MLEALWIVILGMIIIFVIMAVLFFVLIAVNKLFKPAEKKATS